MFTRKHTYLMTLTFSKHGGKYYPKAPKSVSHKGNNVANEFIQTVVTTKDLHSAIEEFRDNFLEQFPKAANFKIDIVKL